MTKAYDIILNILLESGMTADEAELLIVALLEEEAKNFITCKNSLRSLDNLSDEQREKLKEYIKERRKKTYN